MGHACFAFIGSLTSFPENIMKRPVTMTAGALMVQWSDTSEYILFVMHLPVQVAFVLGELTDLSSTTVSAVMSLCQGQAPYVPGQLDCLSSFLVASLDHMTASVSLMHGRLPLNESDEALQEIAQCASAPRYPSYFRCINTCRLALLLKQMYVRGCAAIISALELMMRGKQHLHYQLSQVHEKARAESKCRGAAGPITPGSEHDQQAQHSFTVCRFVGMSSRSWSRSQVTCNRGGRVVLCGASHHEHSNQRATARHSRRTLESAQACWLPFLVWQVLCPGSTLDKIGRCCWRQCRKCRPQDAGAPSWHLVGPLSTQTLV